MASRMLCCLDSRAFSAASSASRAAAASSSSCRWRSSSASRAAISSSSRPVIMYRHSSWFVLCAMSRMDSLCCTTVGTNRFVISDDAIRRVSTHGYHVRSSNRGSSGAQFTHDIGVACLGCQVQRQVANLCSNAVNDEHTFHGDSCVPCVPHPQQPGQHPLIEAPCLQLHCPTVMLHAAASRESDTNRGRIVTTWQASIPPASLAPTHPINGSHVCLVLQQQLHHGQSRIGFDRGGVVEWCVAMLMHCHTLCVSARPSQGTAPGAPRLLTRSPASMSAPSVISWSAASRLTCMAARCNGVEPACISGRQFSTLQMQVGLKVL